MPMSWLPLTSQKQLHDGYCLPACVSMVASYWQKPISQRRTGRILRTSRFGTPSSRIQRLDRHGFDIIYRTGSLEDLHEWMAQQVPCILFVDTSELPYWEVATRHAVVLAGLTNQHAFLFDPYFETVPQTILVGDLMLAWSPFDYAYAVLRPKR